MGKAELERAGRVGRITVACVIFLCSFAWAETFVLENKSGADIVAVYAAPDYFRRDYWSEDHLLSGSTIPPGRERIMEIEAGPTDCQFDIRVQSSTGFERTFESMDLCKNNRVIFNGGVALFIKNRSNTTIYAVQAMPESRVFWGEDQLDGTEVIEGGADRDFMLEGHTDCIYDVRLWFLDERSVEYRQQNLCVQPILTFHEHDILAASNNGNEHSSYVSGTNVSDDGNDALGVSPAPAAATLSDMRSGDTFRDCDDWGCPWMVVVDGGEFERGSWERDDETPVTKVTVPGPFAVGQFEVSVAQFEEFARETDHDAGDACHVKQRSRWQRVEGANWRRPGFLQDGEHPVVCVSWDTALAYTTWVAERTGAPYRLLTEAEAEFLAQASADEFERSGRANCRDCGSSWDGKSTSPVGRLRPDRLGLSGVYGNAAEWVQDCYQGGYSNAPRDGAAWLTESCEKRVVRGGYWYTRARELRPSGRDHAEDGRRHSGVGFRVARGPME